MSHSIIWIISVLAIAGVIVRPFNISEVICAGAGAVLLIVFKLISLTQAYSGIIKGTDVYLFLTGMMLLAETAREEKLFEWLAAHATRMAKGSSTRLFSLIYMVGIIVTTFLSNDATAVVLTPAVAAAVKAAKVTKPLPYLLICAFIANAASFVLPISNPANLVIYGSHLPMLLQWLPMYILPSVCAVTVTFIVLYTSQKGLLKQQDIKADIPVPSLSSGGRMALIGIAATGIVLLVSSALNIQLGLPTAVTGIFTSAIVIFKVRKNPFTIIRGVSWSVLPLVAALFVIVEAVNTTGLVQAVALILQHGVAKSVNNAVWCAGITVAFACNLLNNLPAGLLCANVVQTANVPDMVKSAILVGVDLGPNLSVTGSLATILWLVALRREGQTIKVWTFFKIGLITMTTALIFALGALWI